MVQKILSDTLLDTMIAMLLDHYAWSFHIWLTMLETLKVMQQCHSRLMIANCQKSTIKYREKVEKLLKINFNSEPIYGDNAKYIKTKIKIYGGSINTNF